MKRTIDLSLKAIISILEKRYGIPSGALLDRDRTQLVSNARHHAMHICRNLGGMTFKDIAKVFNRTHPCVILGCKVIDNWLKKDKSFTRLYNQILREILEECRGGQL